MRTTAAVTGITDPMTLPPLEVAARAPGLRDRLAGRAEALLITDLSNVRWLTGFTGSNGWLVVTPDSLILGTDGRYGDQAVQQMAASGAEGDVLVGTTSAQLDGHLADATAPFGSLGFEAAALSHARYLSVATLLQPELVAVDGLVEAARRTKDDGEIARIAEACRIADAALAAVAPTLGDGRTESAVRDQLESEMRRLGASGPSYDTIVATGPRNAAKPHHAPEHVVVEPGHTVVIDVGALYDGYHSDMTRSFLVGDPTALQRELYGVVLGAQMAGVAAVRPGLATIELDALCRGSIADAGYGDWFTHGTGHGVGLVIHEDPFVGRAGAGELQVGDVVTVEPGVYREGFGGIRVEDLLVVTTDGCRVLTRTPKDSPCLPSLPTI